MVTLSALSANLAPSLDLMADIVRNPAFNPAEVERVRTQLVTAVQQARTNPNAMAQRAFMAQMFGASHPYGTTALGDEAAIKRFSRDDLVAFQQRWLRPDKAEFFVVSDRPLSEVQALLTQAFGDWRAAPVAAGQKAFGAVAPRATAPRIVLINRPNSPQSVIYGGEVTPLDPRSDVTASLAGSDVLGSGTFSRIWNDLRETKGWAYSPFSQVVLREKSAPYLIAASVQADRTGDSIAELMSIVKGLLGDKKVTAEELSTQLSAVELVFERKVGENDHLFGSVTSSDIAHELEAKGYTVDRRKISLDEPLKSLGEYHVPVKLHREVTAHVKVTVKGDQVEEVVAAAAASAE